MPKYEIGDLIEYKHDSKRKRFIRSVESNRYILSMDYFSSEKFTVSINFIDNYCKKIGDIKSNPELFI